MATRLRFTVLPFCGGGAHAAHPRDLPTYKIGSIIGVMKMWTVKELAAETGCSGGYVRQEIAAGRLVARKHGWAWAIDDAAARKFVEKHGKKSTEAR